MQRHTFDLSAFHWAILTVRERSRACGCVHTRQKLIGLERTLLSLLMKAERTKPSSPPIPSPPSTVEVPFSEAPRMAVDAVPAKVSEISNGLPDRPRSLQTIVRDVTVLNGAAPLRTQALQDRAKTMRAESKERREQARTAQNGPRKAGSGPAAANQPHTASLDNPPA